MCYVFGISLSNNNYRWKKSPTADSALKFSTEIDILYFKLKLIFDILYLNWYLNSLKSKFFCIFRSIIQFNAALRKQFWCKIIGHGIKWKDFLSGAPRYEPPGILT